MKTHAVTAEITLSPAQIAAAFWSLGSDGQAGFYASLHQISEGMLCLQTAWIVDAIAELSRNGCNDARDGFMTLQAHAIDYQYAAIDIHASVAKREIARYVAGAMT
jgi:hypothetical protein